jgi:hypothetical protein
MFALCAGAEKAVRDIRRATRRHFSAEEKTRMVLEGLRGEDSIAELCRKEGIAQKFYTDGPRVLGAGKKRFARNTSVRQPLQNTHGCGIFRPAKVAPALGSAHQPAPPPPSFKAKRIPLCWRGPASARAKSRASYQHGAAQTWDKPMLRLFSFISER